MRIYHTHHDGTYRGRTANPHRNAPGSIIHRLIDRYELNRSVCMGQMTTNPSRMFNDIGGRARCSRERVALLRQLRGLGIRNVPPGPAHSIGPDLYLQIHARAKP